MSTQKKDLVIVDPKEYGLTDETAKNIQQQFEPMLNKMTELEVEYNQVVSLPIDDVETAKKAKEIRLKYVKVRTGTAEIHKQQKEFYLKGGRFVDGWKNAQLFASQGKEAKLEEIENYHINLEKERIEKLHLDRVELILPYVEDTTHLSLGVMEQDVFDAYFSAKKQAYDDKIEAERLAEENRLAEIEAEKERKRLEEIENERVRQENAKLKAEAEEKELSLQKEREENERKAKEEAERQEAILVAEREKQAKLEAELKAKKDAEAKAEAERLAEIERQKKEAEKLAKAPIKKQLNLWVDGFSIPDISIENDKKKLIEEKFKAFKTWAKSEIENL